MTVERWRNRVGLLETAAVLALVRGAVAVLPLHWLCHGLGLGLRRDAGAVPSERARASADQIKSRIVDVYRRAPILGECLPQALAAAAMLRLRGVRSTLHFGVLKGSATAPLTAHAWLTVGDIVVAGQGMKAAFVEMHPTS